MKIFILNAVMVSVLLYVGSVDFSYAKNSSKDTSELTEVEKDYEALPTSQEEKKLSRRQMKHLEKI